MNEPIIQCFKDEFDRFFGLMMKQVEICPDSLWTAKEGGYIFWQQIYHTLALAEVYALPEGSPSKQTLYPRSVAMLAEDAKKHISKAEITVFAAEMEKLTHEFINSVSVNTLTEKHQRMSNALGRPCTNQQALIGMVRHISYHLGCCDTLLRSHGIKGVY